eukprot:2973244-Prymnesium_polylepis.1
MAQLATRPSVAAASGCRLDAVGLRGRWLDLSLLRPCALVVSPSASVAAGSAGCCAAARGSGFCGVAL